MITLILVGLSVGLISSFFGIGGGTVIVPALYFVYPNLPPQTVIACSLGVIFFNGIINSYNFNKLGLKPSYNIILPLAISMVIGSQMGSHLTFAIPAIFLKRIFSITLVIIGFRLLLKKTVVPEKEAESWALTRNKLFMLILFGLIGGLIAGLTGIGGGVIIIPTLIALFQMSFKYLPAFSNPAMSISALSGVITFFLNPPESPVSLNASLDPFQFGYLNGAVVVVLVITSALTSKWGVKLTQIVPQARAQKAFAFLMFFLAGKLYFS